MKRTPSDYAEALSLPSVRILKLVDSCLQGQWADSDRVADLRLYLDSMPDPRARRGRCYSLTAILLVGACAVVSGASPSGASVPQTHC